MLRHYLLLTFVVALSLSQQTGAGEIHPFSRRSRRCLSDERKKLVWEEFDKWVKAHPQVSEQEVVRRQSKLNRHLDCDDPPQSDEPPTQTPASKDDLSPLHAAPEGDSSSTALLSSLPREPVAPAIHRNASGQHQLILATCLTEVTSAMEADKCRNTHNHKSLHPTWDPQPKLAPQQAADSIVLHVLVDYPVEASAIFYTRVVGPSSVQSAKYFHVKGKVFGFKFAAVESGVHKLYIRLEYADYRHTLWEGSSFAHPKYLSIDIPDSPFQINVASGNRLRSAKLRSLKEFPFCKDANRGGLWADVQQLAQVNDNKDATFQPERQHSGCPDCKNPRAVDRSTFPKTCAVQAATSKSRLTDDGYNPWYKLDAWLGRDRKTGEQCKYCRLGRKEAKQCLDKTRLTIVGDSVGMQFCSYAQCAYSGVYECGSDCTHRRNPLNLNMTKLAMECYERQEGAGPVFCVSIDNFLGESLTGGDRGIQVTKKYSQQAVKTWVSDARSRAEASTPSKTSDGEDVEVRDHLAVLAILPRSPAMCGTVEMPHMVAHEVMARASVRWV
ncbi:hypothetical protein CYMTET_17073 [Cymbomonas tetramitiformis]|uniref:Uncharacterized protein n=1 Tax=Cymbomonas tetramitiformis TaxID=36881 RepID=A0AAE0GAN8_9CHLO|nr:hypothetical protein CYMTET_17073 [Cymbomonas tetramitiformis]